MVGVLIFFIVKYAFSKKEKWAWWCLFLSLIGWVFIDTPISWYFKVYFNVFFNVVLLLSVLIPLILTYKAFFKRHNLGH